MTAGLYGIDKEGILDIYTMLNGSVQLKVTPHFLAVSVPSRLLTFISSSNSGSLGSTMREKLIKGIMNSPNRPSFSSSRVVANTKSRHRMSLFDQVVSTDPTEQCLYYAITPK